MAQGGGIVHFWRAGCQTANMHGYWSLNLVYFLIGEQFATEYPFPLLKFYYRFSLLLCRVCE